MRWTPHFQAALEDQLAAEDAELEAQLIAEEEAKRRAGMKVVPLDTGFNDAGFKQSLKPGPARRPRPSSTVDSSTTVISGGGVATRRDQHSGVRVVSCDVISDADKRRVGQFLDCCCPRTRPCNRGAQVCPQRRQCKERAVCQGRGACRGGGRGWHHGCFPIGHLNGTDIAQPVEYGRTNVRTYRAPISAESRSECHQRHVDCVGICPASILLGCGAIAGRADCSHSNPFPCASYVSSKHNGRV